MKDFDWENQNTNGRKKDLLNTSSSSSQRMPNNKKTEKKALIFLILLVLLALPFSVWQISRQLSNPLKPKKTNTTNSLSAAANTETPRIESLRQQDTDQDGLTDYDELYVYKTSPYLKDSDSDKIDDKTEIEQGTDPNCPKGQTCGRTVSNTNGNVNSAGNINTSLLADLTNVSPEQLRQIMIDAGAPADQVNKISDDELLKTYQEILASEAANLNISTTANANNANTSISAFDYDTLLNLQPAEIRQLMTENGVPKETLDQVDDATLLQIYQDSLQQNLTNSSTNTNAAL